MDALSTTLGAVALFAPLFNACKKLRQHYRLTRTFGEDYLVVQRHIDTQYARLEQLSKRAVRDLPGHERINVHDENDPTIRKIISILAEMKKQSNDCAELMGRYHGSCEPDPGMNTTTLQPANRRASPHSTTPASTINALDTNRVEVPHKVEKKRFLHVKTPWKSKNREVAKAIEAPEQPKLETPAAIPGGRSQPSILDTAEVRQEVERQRTEAAKKQSSTPFLRRLSWAQSDKIALTKLAEALQRGNNEIESFLLPSPMEKNALLLPPDVRTEKMSVTVGLVKRALGKLHEALAKLNAPADTFHRKDHQQNYHLSVQLREDSEVNRRQLLQEPKVHLRDDSYIFNIQRQENADPEKLADLLFVETLKNPQAEREPILNTGSPMSELHDLTLPPVTDEGVETIGFFRTPSSRANIHVLFRDSSKRFHSPLHLADIVSSSNYRYYMNPTQLVQLVRLVMKSYLFFSFVRDSLDINPQLKNFRYFCKVGEKATEWDIEKPLVLRPWLSFGFGSTPRRYNLGEEQGVQGISSSSLIELGLVLYQVCVGEVLDYGAGSSVTKAKWTALKRLNKIDNAVGPTMTEIVQVLLSPTSLVTAGEKIGGNEEIDYILNAITTLITYEEKIEDTMTDAEKEAPPPPLHFDPEESATSEVILDQAVGGAADNNRSHE